MRIVDRMFRVTGLHVMERKGLKYGNIDDGETSKNWRARDLAAI